MYSGHLGRRLRYSEALALVRDGFAPYATLGFAPTINETVEAATSLGLIWQDWVGERPSIAGVLDMLKSAPNAAQTLKQIAAVCSFREGKVAEKARALGEAFASDESLAEVIAGIIISRSDRFEASAA